MGSGRAGRGSRRARTLRVGKRGWGGGGGGRKPGNLLLQDMSANKYANKYKYSSVKIMMLRRR